MSTQSIQEAQNEIVEEFGFFEDWMDKYEHLIEIGKELPIIDDDHKTEEYLVKGCQSQVWLNAEFKDGKIYFTADSDALITKGLIGLLVRVMSGQPPEDIVNADMSFIDKIGMREHLSPTRSNGLSAMVKQMKMYALALKSKAG